MSLRQFPILVAAVVLCIATAFATGCAREKAPDVAAGAPKVEKDRIAFPPGSAQLTSIHVEAAELREETPLKLTGRLIWDEDRTARVSAPIAGRIISTDGKLGQRVEAGHALVTLSSPDFGQAQADAARAAADLAAAERNRERLSKLVERGAAPQKELDAAMADLARARAEANRTAARLLRWGGEAGRSVDQTFVIRSPVEGVIVERNVNPGMEVRPDLPAPLFVVTEPARLWIALDVPETDLSSATRGAGLTVRTPVYQSRTFPGLLDYIGQSLDPATRTLKARGVIENGENLLKAEMYVTAEVRPKNQPKLVVVPSQAVLSQGEKRYVFVEEKPGLFVKTLVAVGREREGRISVTSGIAQGTRVVTEGSILLAGMLGPGAGA